jgi:hypothetical protein
MKNMGAVFMNIDIIPILGIYISTNMGTPVNYKTFLTAFYGSVSKNRGKKTGSNKKVIISHRIHS